MYGSSLEALAKADADAGRKLDDGNASQPLVKVEDVGVVGLRGTPVTGARGSAEEDAATAPDDGVSARESAQQVRWTTTAAKVIFSCVVNMPSYSLQFWLYLVQYISSCFLV